MLSPAAMSARSTGSGNDSYRSQLSLASPASNTDSPLLSRKQRLAIFRQERSASQSQSHSGGVSESDDIALMELYRDNFGIVSQSHWDDYIAKHHMLPRANDRPVLRHSISQEEANDRKMMDRRQICVVNPQSLLGNAVLAMSKQYQLPSIMKKLNEIKVTVSAGAGGSGSEQESKESVSDSACIDDGLSVVDSISISDSTFLTSVPITDTDSRSTTNTSTRTDWTATTTIDELVAMIASLVTSDTHTAGSTNSVAPVLSLPLSLANQLPFLLTSCSAYHSLPVPLTSLITSEISLSLLTDSFFYFLVLLFGNDSDCVNYVSWETELKRYQEYESELESFNQSETIAKNKSTCSDSKRSQRYTNYESYDQYNEFDKGVSSVGGASEEAKSNESVSVSDSNSGSGSVRVTSASTAIRHRPQSVVVKPGPFKPSQQSLTGPTPYQSLTANHRHSPSLAALMTSMSENYLRLFTLVKPYHKDAWYQCYYDLIAECLYHCYIEQFPHYVKFIDTPLFRQRLVRATCQLFTGYVSTFSDCQHWRVGGKGRAAGRHRWSVLNIDERAQSAATTTITQSSLPTTSAPTHAHARTVPMLLTRHLALLEHSPLVQKFLNDRHFHHKHLRLALPVPLSFPLTLSSDIIDLSIPPVNTALRQSVSKYRAMKATENDTEEKEVAQMEQLKRSQHVQYGEALKEREKFASQLVKASQSEKYSALKMNSKQLALKRLNHARTNA